MKHKAICTIALLLVSMLFCLNASYAQSTSYGLAVIDGKTSDRVHLRAASSTESKSLGLFFSGTEVRCLSNPSEEWCKVSIGSQTGYIKTEFLYTGNDYNVVVSRNPTGIVDNKSSSWVNLRKEPSLQASRISKLNNGEIVIILGETTDLWYYVKTADMYGYVKATYINTSTTNKADDIDLSKLTRSELLALRERIDNLLSQSADGNNTDKQTKVVGAYYNDNWNGNAATLILYNDGSCQYPGYINNDNASWYQVDDIIYINFVNSTDFVTYNRQHTCLIVDNGIVLHEHFFEKLK